MGSSPKPCKANTTVITPQPMKSISEPQTKGNKKKTIQKTDFFWNLTIGYTQILSRVYSESSPIGTSYPKAGMY